MAAAQEYARKAGQVLSSRVPLEAGGRHAGPEGEAATTPLQRAIRQRDGTMVAFVALIPIRRDALAGLRIGEALIDGPAALTPALPGELTKNGLPHEGGIAEPAVGLLRRYLDETRPFLMARGGQRHDMLWVGNEVAAMSYSYVGRRSPTSPSA